MSTFSGLEVKEIPLFITRRRREWEEFLERHNLDATEPLTAAGLYDADDILRGCASLCRCGSGLSIQCVAMDETIGEHGQIGRLIDFLRPIASDWCNEHGVSLNLVLFTKPEYENQFHSLAFHSIGNAPQAVMLESDPNALAEYTAYLRSRRRSGTNGVIVMNANPCTLGHVHLISRSAALVDNLYVIPVFDDSAHGFPYSLRRKMLIEATESMPNVEVLRGSRYAVSAATFPTYFIKQLTERTDTHILLDLDIFLRHIVPALDIKHRFVGTEPADELTAHYNELMHRQLPANGVEVHELQRFAGGKSPIQATNVRQALQRGHLRRAFAMLPPTSQKTVLADMAMRALESELEVDPKPGLVTPTSKGSHSDMDYALMSRGIAALRPYFELLASTPMTHEELVSAGLHAEQEMLKATDGVNTHKGAIFALGLMVTAAAELLRGHLDPTEALLSNRISFLAASFKEPENTNGAQARKSHNLCSALDMARTGYSRLLTDWLPYYRNLPGEQAERRRKLLLRIMSVLDDTNICHRGGIGALRRVQTNAKSLSENYSVEALKDFCHTMERESLSPGGAADMLALTLLADLLIPNNAIK